MSRKVRSLLALFVLTLFLGTGAAHALPMEGRDQDPGMLAAVWEWVASLLEGRVPFLQTHEAVGGPAVPIPPPPQTNGDYGGYIDPNG